MSNIASTLDWLYTAVQNADIHLLVSMRKLTNTLYNFSHISTPSRQVSSQNSSTEHIYTLPTALLSPHNHLVSALRTTVTARQDQLCRYKENPKCNKHATHKNHSNLQQITYVKPTKQNRLAVYNRSKHRHTYW